MKSPFPGMDPFLEACGLWEDFQDDPIGEIKHHLAAALPAGYLARTSKRSYVLLDVAKGKEETSPRADMVVTLAPATAAESSP